MKPGLFDANTHVFNWFTHKPWTSYKFRTVSLNRNNLEAVLLVKAGVMLIASSG